MNGALLRAFVETLYPDADVRLDSASNDWLVTIRVSQKEIAAARINARAVLTRVRDQIRPRPVKQRRLRWMKIHRRGRHCA